MGNTNCVNVPCLGNEGPPSQGPNSRNIMRRDRNNKNGVLTTKQRVAMRNSLSLPAGDYDSLLLHERIASNSVRGLAGLGDEGQDASKLINGGMYQDVNDLTVQIYGETVHEYNLPLASST